MINIDMRNWYDSTMTLRERDSPLISKAISAVGSAAYLVVDPRQTLVLSQHGHDIE